MWISNYEQKHLNPTGQLDYICLRIYPETIYQLPTIQNNEEALPDNLRTRDSALYPTQSAFQYLEHNWLIAALLSDLLILDLLL